jgi:hypothetical protein
MALTPNIPMVNLGYKNIQGGRLSSVLVAVRTLTIAAGQFRDSTDTNDIVLPALVTVNGAVNGANGLDTGVLVLNTFYAVYVIASSIFGGSTQSDSYLPPAGLISTNATTPLLPAGYDMFRRIGFVLTDGAVNFLPFRQTGDSVDRWMWYDTPIAVLGATASAIFVAQSLATAVPPEATNVVLQATLTPAAAGDFVALRPTGSASATGYAKMSGDVMGVAHIDDMTVPCNATPSIDWITDAASTVALAVEAYLDEL